jgi:hypothetical protein
MKDAVVVVRAIGCHNPAQAQITGTATGLVDGHKQIIPLKLTPLPEPGMYAVTQQWPKSGSFALSFIGTNSGMTTSLVVHVTGSDVERTTAKRFARAATPAEIEAALQP